MYKPIKKSFFGIFKGTDFTYIYNIFSHIKIDTEILLILSTTANYSLFAMISTTFKLNKVRKMR